MIGNGKADLIVLKDEVKRDENRVMKFRGKVQSHSISI
jgi:hypothetical protein